MKITERKENEMHTFLLFFLPCIEEEDLEYYVKFWIEDFEKLPKVRSKVQLRLDPDEYEPINVLSRESERIV